MQQCLDELHESDLPEEFKLREVRSLLRYLREVRVLVSHVQRESGFECDTTAYLDILSAKEDANLVRKVSHTRVLKQVMTVTLGSSGRCCKSRHITRARAKHVECKLVRQSLSESATGRCARSALHSGDTNPCLMSTQEN